jgi:hypothetical protein
MAYGDFSLKMIEDRFAIASVVEPLFGDVVAAPVPQWLTDTLTRGMKLPLVSEKMRGELLVMPTLLAARELVGDAVVVYSGVRLDVDPARGLSGECDFLVTRGQPLPELQPPFLAMVEAKRDFIESGFGQCAAQMVGARLFNEQAGRVVPTVYGCVTTGERWHFLRLDGSRITIDTHRYFPHELDRILGVFRSIFTDPAFAPRAAA